MIKIEMDLEHNSPAFSGCDSLVSGVSEVGTSYAICLQPPIDSENGKLQVIIMDDENGGSPIDSANFHDMEDCIKWLRKRGVEVVTNDDYEEFQTLIETREREDAGRILMLGNLSFQVGNDTSEVVMTVAPNFGMDEPFCVYGQIEGQRFSQGFRDRASAQAVFDQHAAKIKNIIWYAMHNDLIKPMIK